MFTAETEAEVAQLSPLMSYSPFWYWVILFVLIGTVLLTIFLFARLKPATVKPQLRHVATNSYVDEMNKVYALVHSNEMSVQEGYQRVSLVIREFIATKSNLPAHNMTLQELEYSSAPPKVLHSLSMIYPIIFGDAKVSGVDEFNYFMNVSRGILDGWWD